MNDELDDPVRWNDGAAPRGGLALLATLDQPPPLPGDVRARVGEAVRAQGGPRLTVPWTAALGVAAVALLGFAAGWLWHARTPTLEPTSIAAEAPNRTREAIPGPSPADEEPVEVGANEPVGPDTRPAAPSPNDLLDPFAESSERPPSRSRMTRRASPMDFIDPFAERSATRTVSPMRSSMQDLLNPFARPPVVAQMDGEPTMEPDPADRFRRPPFATRDQPHGLLVINTIPWSHVFVDGVDTGQNTPIRNLRVTPGRHRIGLRTVDGKMHTVMVDVTRGHTMRVMHRL